MDKDSRLYVLFHYLVMIGILFGAVSIVELTGSDVPLWLGFAFAIVLGLSYPKIVVSLGVGPTRWGG